MPLPFSPALSHRIAYLLLATTTLTAAAPALAADGVFDEMRFGVTTSIAAGDKQEDGVFPSFTVYFDPFDADGATDLGEKLLRPGSMPAQRLRRRLTGSIRPMAV